MTKKWESSPIAIVVTAAVVLCLGTLISYDSVPKASVFHDTKFYFAQSDAGYVSWDLWAGKRVPLPVLVFKLCDTHPDRIRIAQSVLSVASWTFLAASVVFVIRRAWARVLGAALVSSVALSNEIVKWNHSLLSESVAISALALFVAACVWATRRRDAWGSVAVGVTGTLYAFARDSNAYVVLVSGLALVLWGIVAAVKREAAVPRLGLGAALIAVFLLSNASADRERRWYYPLKNVFAYRILPDEQMTRAFREAGMPEVPAGRSRPSRGRDPNTADFRRWLKLEGKSAYVRYLLTHPGYLLGGPARGIGTVLSGRSAGYSKHRVWTPAPVDVLWQRAGWHIHAAALVAVLALALSIRSLRTPLVFVGAATAILVVPHALVVWHGDAIELARHGLLVWLQIPLALLLIVVGIVDSIDTGAASRFLREKLTSKV